MAVLCELASFAHPGFASVFGFGSFWSLQRARAVAGGHCEVSWTSQQDTPQGADVDGSQGGQLPLSAIVDLVVVL